MTIESTIMVLSCVYTVSGQLEQVQNVILLPTHQLWHKIIHNLSTTRPEWRLDGPALSGHLLYSLVSHAYANPFHHRLVR